MRQFLLILRCLALLVMLPACAHSLDYSIVDLGPRSNNKVYAINDLGQAVGNIGIDAVIWNPDGSTTNMSQLCGGVHAKPLGINNTGLVVGVSGSDAFLWSSSSGITKLTGLFGVQNTACDVNDSGLVAGNTVQNGLPSAAVWKPDGGVVDLSEHFGQHSYLKAVNNLGQVLGGPAGSGDVIIWDTRNNSKTSLGPGMYTDINDKTQVLMRRRVDGTYGSTYVNSLWSEESGFIPTTMPAGWGIFTGYGLNNLGQVAGASGYQQKGIAVIWDTGDITVLPGLGGNSEALDINDQGWVIGYSTDTSGIQHSVIWKPVPEPSNLVTLLCGFSGLAGYACRRKR